jgi:glycosyltransferase involved in cell wall biosynthesis
MIKVVDTFETYGEKDNFNFIFVDDCSSDMTHLEMVRSLAHFERRKISNVYIVRLDRHAGKGNALKEGFLFRKKLSQFDEKEFVLFLDSDLDIVPSAVFKFFNILGKREKTIVIGSKRHPDSRVNYPLTRKILSWGFYNLVKFLFNLPITDSQVGAKLFPIKVVNDLILDIKSEGYLFDLELLIRAFSNGYSVLEAPINLDFQSKIDCRLFGYYSFCKMKQAIFMFCRALLLYNRLKKEKLI